MREGLDRDDIYIMVEDEFHAVAKTFTQHLHHAEYVRLKSMAKNRSLASMPPISRPTDSRTLMREDTKRRKEKEAKAAKQKAGLDQIKAHAASRRPKADTEDESEGDTAAHDDPWVGTTLQGLMTSSSRQQMSLTGLQGVKSHTRAAAGFSKPKKPQQQTKTFNLAPQKTTTKGKQTSRPDYSSGEVSTSEDANDDDLEAPAVERKAAVPRSSAYIQLESKRYPQDRPLAPDTSSKRRAARDRNAAPTSSLRSVPTSKSSLLRRNDNPSKSKSVLKRNEALPSLSMFDDALPRPTPLKSAVSQRILQRRADLARIADEQSEAEKTASRLNEIPIW